MRKGVWALAAAAVLVAVPSALSSPTVRTAPAASAWPRGVAVVGYRSPAALRFALARFPARIVDRIRALKVVEVRPEASLPRFAASLSRLPGITYVERVAPRVSTAEPALAPSFVPGGAYEWQFAATRADAVPASVLRAAGSITMAVIDTGADLTAPDLAAKSPLAYSAVTGAPDVRDLVGHGTFVASLAAGSVSNGDGIAGFGGDARLIVVKASRPDGSFTDVDEAKGIVYAVDHGARVINLSLGGPETSRTERNAINYAVSRGALLIAAAGNEYGEGNPVEYPAALLQPEGSNGVGGVGLSVGASTLSGARAGFSNTGSYLSLAAPGENVFGAVSATSPTQTYPRVALPGSTAGLYGFASGTSFATPQVAGAAALVWAVNPSLTAQAVARILKETASGHGTWNPELGFGVIDVARAVERAGAQAAAQRVELDGSRRGRTVQLSWRGDGAAGYRLSVREDEGPARVLLSTTTATSASYNLTPGHTYSFTVAAVDGSGLETATSAPYTVTVVHATASLRLAASRTKGEHPLRVQFTATLRSDTAEVSPGARVVVLESFTGGGWRRADSSPTNASGRVSWMFSLGPGSYRVRARFLGTDDLMAATSAPVALAVR